jgi:hypothetical protein
MTKLYLTFIAVLALSVGCAITNYPCITDNTGSGPHVVNTNGKAVIVPTSQVITIFPGGKYVELFTMIDQKADCSGTLSTYTSIKYGTIAFLDYQYCNPDWTGCAVWVSQNGPPIFDGVWKTSCDGWDAVSLLVSFGSRSMECGRGLLRSQLTPGAEAQLLSDLTVNGDNYMLRLDRSNFQLDALNDGLAYPIPTYGATALIIDDKGRLQWNLSSKVKPSVNILGSIPHDQLQMTYKGYSVTMDATLMPNFVSTVAGF